MMTLWNQLIDIQPTNIETEKPAEAMAADAGFSEVHEEVKSMQSGDRAYQNLFPITSDNPAGAIPHLLKTLDRPIAFQRCFVTLTKSVTAALLLSQALYWQRRCKDPEGWWYKTREDWAEETGLGRYEQEGARRRLCKLGLMQERLRGVPATIWYQVNEEQLLEGLSKIAQQKVLSAVQLVENQPTGWRENHQQVGRKSANQSARFAPTFKEQRLRRDYTETTTTTPNPSSPTKRMAATEPEHRRRLQDEQPQNQDGNPEAATLEANTENPVSREAELASPIQVDHSGTPTENPKTVSQEVIENDPQPEPAALTPRPPKESVHDEPVSHISTHAETESAEVDIAEVANEPGIIKTLTCTTQDEATLETASAATPDEADAVDTPQTAQNGQEGEKPAVRYISISMPLAEPPRALQADLTQALRAAVGNAPPPPPPAILPPALTAIGKTVDNIPDIAPSRAALGTTTTAAPLEDALTATCPAEAEEVTLVYPTKLTALERTDMVVQVRPLPFEVAQQMLDVIEAKIKTAQIKTNPAALLRGLVRKYRAAPDSFDPSPGFHIAEQRHRRLEMEAQAQAEAAQRARERESRCPTPAARAVGRQALASMLRTLRGR